jgi:hypothetical protein
MLICRYCLEQFEAKRSDAKFCSPSHRVLFSGLTNDEKADKVNSYLGIMQNGLPPKADELATLFDPPPPEPENLVEQPWLQFVPKQIQSDAEFDKIKETFNRPIEPVLEIPEWVQRVEDYCNKSNCTCDDLIEAHKQSLMPKKKQSLSDVVEKKAEALVSGSNYFRERQKKLLGI